MGDFIYFRFNPDGAVPADVFETEDHPAEHLGHAYFSTFALRGQQEVYGLDWADCVTYGDEQVGTPGAPGVGGWYTPDWDRAVKRVDQLRAAWEATTDAHRKAYDAGKIDTLWQLIHRCADHPQRQFCEVRIQ